jgi:hypothetical protein
VDITGIPHMHDATSAKVPAPLALTYTPALPVSLDMPSSKGNAIINIKIAKLVTTKMLTDIVSLVTQLVPYVLVSPYVLLVQVDTRSMLIHAQTTQIKSK